MKVSNKYLIVIAGIVWLIAGVNILRIGIVAFTGQNHILPILLAAAAVFLLFHLLVFLKMVNKHVVRIQNYKEPKHHVLQFFDKKSYLIMFCMITFGIGLRASGICPDFFIAAFYSGLGMALVAAGIGFEYRFIQQRNHSKPIMED